MIRTASGLKPMPTPAELEARSRQTAKEMLLEAGCDPATIEEEVIKFLAKPLSFEIPSNKDLLAMYEKKNVAT
jgi:hypothetical protein